MRPYKGNSKLYNKTDERETMNQYKYVMFLIILFLFHSFKNSLNKKNGRGPMFFYAPNANFSQFSQIMTYFNHKHFQWLSTPSPPPPLTVDPPLLLYQNNI